MYIWFWGFGHLDRREVSAVDVLGGLLNDLPEDFRLGCGCDRGKLTQIDCERGKLTRISLDPGKSMNVDCEREAAHVPGLTNHLVQID